MIKDKVVVILGPTSSGKSDVAIKLAKKFNGEIISADSRQIYRRLDIGTGKVRGAWSTKHGAFISEKIPHYIIDIVNPTVNYNVSHFKKDAEILIKDILSRGKIPIICGGTGFWIKAVVDNVNLPEVKPDWKLRNKLSNKSIEALFKLLNKMDPKRAKGIDKFNKVRLIRAIEICKSLGKVPKIVERGAWSMEHEFLQIGIKINKEKLYVNIKKRLQKRFKEGMIEEVKKLHKQGLSWKKIQSFGLGYFWIPIYFKSINRQKKLHTESSLGNKLYAVWNEKILLEMIYQAEKDYAKRQMTWFQKNKRIKWIGNYKEIEKEVQKFLLK